MNEPIRLHPYQPFEQISARHFRYTPEDSRYRLDVSGMWQDKHGVHGRLKVYRQADSGEWHCKHFEDGHLSTKTFYDRFLKTAQEIQPAVPWLMWLQAFLLRIIDAADRIEPAQRARDIPLLESPVSYCADVILADVPNLIWAQGGTGKSWLGAWLSVCIASGTPWLGHEVRQGPVLYYDWEAGGAAWRRRLEMITRGLGLDRVPEQLHYRYCSRPLTAMEETFAQDLYDHQVAVAIFDAVGGAEGEKKEFADSRDGIMAIFALLRAHRVTSVLIDHVAGEGLKKPSEVAKPYGSVYKINQARNAWMLVRQPGASGRITTYHLQHKKVNEGLLNYEGHVYELDGSRIGQVRFHVGELEDRAGDAGTWVPEMDSHLAALGQAPAEELARVSRAAYETVRKYLARHPERYESVQGPGRVRLWRLRPEEEDRDIPDGGTASEPAP